jgi:excinuclease ABC subunit B
MILIEKGYMAKFKIQTSYSPAGDQPKAIAGLVSGVQKGLDKQILLGVTGSGKTYTAANVIAQLQKPTLVIAHNKTLAAQLTQEYRSYFPDNTVEYFVSYYDYYQPEAYMPGSDTYIEKEAQINEEIDRLRHAATQALLTKKDVIIVASVSCIYNIGSPELYSQGLLILQKGMKMDRDKLIGQLLEMQFIRRPSDVLRGTFRVVGSTFEIMPANEEKIYRIVITADAIKEIIVFDPVTRDIISHPDHFFVYPAKHYVTDKESFKQSLQEIRKELNERLKELESENKLLEAERLKRRTNYDLEMLEETGFVGGIENYSRYFDGRKPGEKPHSLLEFFPKDYLVVIDESHVTIPQIGGMYEGDRSRKQTLIDHGFRLPSALDNRPLRFNEFDSLVKQAIYTSATPGKYELQHSKNTVEQIIRPTGLIDPELIIKPITGQIEDLKDRIDERIKAGERVLVTTLTKKMAEDLSGYLKDKNYKVNYMHSDVVTLDRIETLTKLRTGEYDIVVGVNLLREGLDLPEVSLVAILDADKEGFLRSETSLIQTIGRAARNVNGQVIMYADKITDSMRRAIDETNRRREKQIAFNKEHNITPRTIIKEVKDITQELNLVKSAKNVKKMLELETLNGTMDYQALRKQKEAEMKKAAKNLEFELAGILRDEIIELGKLERKNRKEALAANEKNTVGR